MSNVERRRWVIPMENDHGYYRPDDPQKRCGAQDCEWGYVEFQQFGPDTPCDVCDGTAMIKPYRTKQKQLDRLFDLLGDVSWEDVEEKRLDRLVEQCQSLPMLNNSN
jgi:hypothetical protein